MMCNSATRPGRSGITLIELLVVLAIVGVAAGIAGLGTRAGLHNDPAGATTVLRRARHRAITINELVTVEFRADTLLVTATAFPDGRLIADTLKSSFADTGHAIAP